MSADKPIIGITMGDPAGIGSEVIVKAIDDLRDFADVLVIGDASVIRETAANCGIELPVHPVSSVEESAFDRGTLDVVDLDNVDELDYGVISPAFGQASLEYVELAIEMAMEGAIDAITTAPINKQSIRLGGGRHAGHTELLADHTDTADYSMMLIEDDLIVTHMSTHIPLREACDSVTEERLTTVIDLSERGLTRLGIDDPTLAVAGINPHASDGGLLGSTEAEEIEPAIETARGDGIDVQGPESPDTVFVRAASGEFDCVVAMYHDQGHIPIKMLGFQRGNTVSGVNMTLGLPIVRTSVDHGTAFDIAGQCTASPASLIDAVSVASTVVRSEDRGHS